MLACLYSRSDKLSEKCEYALYDAAIQLQRAVAALSYLVNECAGDLNRLCQGVEAGEGRLLTCLDNNAKDVSQRCKDAIVEVEIELMGMGCCFIFYHCVELVTIGATDRWNDGRSVSDSL